MQCFLSFRKVERPTSHITSTQTPSSPGESESHVNRSAAQAHRAGAFCLAAIEEEFERTGTIGSAQCLWLLEECGRLQRANHALDLAVKARETELLAKDRDYSGLVSEWQDLADENRRLKQDLEIARLQTGVRNQTGEP